MTQRSYYWNGRSVGDAVLSRYDTDTLALLERLKFQPYPERQSALGGGCTTCDGLEVTAGGAGWSDIEIAAGCAMVNGRYFSNTAAVTLNMTLNTGSWWAVVLRSDIAAQTIRLALKGPYVSNASAYNSPTQNDDLWEVVIATVYQGAVSPTIYDQRLRTIRQSYRYLFVPAVSGYNTTHSTYLQHRSSMGWLMPEGDEAYVGGQFMFDYDLWDDPIITPILIPLGSVVAGADVYIEQAYDWGVDTADYNTNTFSSGYSAETIVEQIINTPVNYAFNPQPVVRGGLITCRFFRDATNVADTYTGSLYCPGWKLEYISYTK